MPVDFLKSLFYFVLQAFLFVMAFLMGELVEAQPYYPSGGNYFSKFYSQDNGMAGVGGYLLERDKRGFLWIGGYQGLSRFDGHAFKNYHAEDGLGDNNIWRIHSDTNGRLYVSTANKLVYFTGNTEHPFEPALRANKIKDIHIFYPIDSTHIYVSENAPNKLYYINHNQVKPVKGTYGTVADLMAEKNGILYALMVDGNIYVIKEDRILNSIHISSFEKESIANAFRMKLLKDSSEKIYYSASHLWRLQEHSPIVRPFTRSEKIPVHYSYTMSHDQSHGIFRIGNKEPELMLSLPQDNIETWSDLNYQSGNVFWFICNNGLFYYYPKLYTILPYIRQEYYFVSANDYRSAMRHDSVKGEDPLIRRYCKEFSNILRRLYESRDSTTWLCTSKGLYYLPKQQRKLHHFILEPNDGHCIIQSPLEDRKGRIWFETDRGVVRFEHGQFKHWGKTQGATDYGIYASVIDRRGYYYGASNNLFVITNDTATSINDDLAIGHDFIEAMAKDKSEDVWICPNDHSLIKIGYDPQKGFYRADSLALEINCKPFIAKSINFDCYGNLWVISYGQLAIYFRQPDGRFIPTDKLVMGADQHLNDFTNLNARIVADEQRLHMYVIKDSMLLNFDVRKILTSYHRQAPNVQLTDVLLFQKETNWESLGIATDPYGLPITPVLTNNQNFISFRFTGMVNLEANEVVYKYKLEGLEKDWHPLTKLQEANYTNLPPGSYVFKLKAADINGLWSMPLQYKFTILPPWYRTWLAWSVWSIFAVGGIALLFALNLRIVKRRATMKRLIVEEQLKALRAQINPHFLQNTFTFLANSLEEQPVNYSVKVIEQLSSYLRNVLYLSDETVVTLEDELAFAEEYLAINKLLFYNKFDYVIHVGDDVDTIAIQLPSMLLQPLLENALKHSGSGKEGKTTLININVFTEGDFVHCVISNTIAFTPKEDHKANYKPKGLAITMQRLNLLYRKTHHQPKIETKPETDTYSVIIKLPL